MATRTEIILTKFEADIKDIKSKQKVLEADMRKTTKAAKSTSKALKGVGREVKNMATRFIGFAAAVALVVNSIDKIKKFEKAIDELSSITGATGDQLEFLKQKSLELGATTTIGATQAANAFKLIASARPELLKDAQALAQVTKEAVTLAEASGLELEPAALALAGTMNQFGVESSEAARIINVLAAGSKEGAAAIPAISAAIERFGTVAAASNLTVEQSVGLIETLAGKNIQGAEAGTALRNVILRLQQAGKGYVNGIFDINAALQEVADANLSTVEATELFGLVNVTAGQILTDNIDKIDEYTEKVTGTSTAVEQAAINTDNFSGDLTRAANAWDGLILSLDSGDGVLTKSLRGVTDFATSILQLIETLNKGGDLLRFTLGFSELSEEAQAAAENARQVREQYIKDREAEFDADENLQAQAFARSLSAINRRAENEQTLADAQAKLREENAEKQKKANEKLAKQQEKEIKEEQARSKSATKLLQDAANDRVKAIEEQIEKTKELREQEAEDERERKDAEQLADIERDKALAEAKESLNSQLEASALGLSAALRTAASESAGITIALLAFEKLAAISKIIISLQEETALYGALGPAGIPLQTKAVIAASARIATVIATAIPQLPKFHTGTSFVTDGRGSNEVHAILERGEGVVTGKANKMYPGLVDAANKQRVEEWISSNNADRIINAIKKAEHSDKKGFAENVATSLIAQGGKFYDGNIVNQLESTRRLTKAQHKELLKALKGDTYHYKRKF